MNIKEQLSALLESVDPDQAVFSAEKRDQLGIFFESKIEEKVEAAVAEVDEKNFNELKDLIELFKAKQEEALDAQDADYAEKTEELLALQDEDYAEKTEELLALQDEDYADKTEELLALQDADYADKAQEMLDLQDADYADKAQEMLDLQDADYTAKAEEMLAAVSAGEEVDTEELEATIADLEAKIEELESAKASDEEEEDTEEEDDDDELNESIEHIVEAVDEHLENFLDTDGSVVVDQAKYEKVLETLDSLKELLVLSDEDTEEVVNQKEEELEEALNENVRLRKEMDNIILESTTKSNETEAKQLLESKISGYDRTKQVYLRQVFKGRQTSDVDSLLNEAVEAYDKELFESRYAAKRAHREQDATYTDAILSESTLSDVDNSTSNVGGPDMSAYIQSVAAMDEHL